MNHLTSSPVRVLVVEDSLNDQELLHRQLRKTPLGNHVQFISDPRAALKLLRDPEAQAFREGLVAIFLDVQMPHMSGIDLLRKLRATGLLNHIPVIMMTSSPHPEVIEAARELEVAVFAEKPVTLTQFSKTLADLFHQTQPAEAA